MTDTRILELEHQTIRPIGEFRSHCALCADVAETRDLQASCPHADEDRQEIDVTGLGSTRTVTLAHCGRCGASLPSREHS